MPVQQAAAPGYLSQPAIRGGQLAFRCEDNLWLAPAEGGRAERLTALPGQHAHPRFSPGGDQLAFTGTADGAHEVFILPLQGGPARRLTFQGAQRCVVLGWHPPTGNVLYTSDAEQPPGFGQRLFAVDPAGGIPRSLPYGPATALAYGPGGRTVLARNATDPARWKRYRGGTAGELWIGDDRPGARFRLLLRVSGNLAFPAWADGRVWFVSDHEGCGNVYSCTPDGAEVTRHTSHEDFYARALHSDGSRLVYQAGADLYLLDPAVPGERRIDVAPRLSGVQRETRFEAADEHLGSVRLSPDGSAAVLETRGLLFTMEHWSGPVRAHGAQAGVRHRHPAWLPDGRRLIACVSDEGSEERMALFDVEGDGAGVDVALPDIGRVLELSCSPAADTVALATHRHELFLIDLDALGPDARPRVRLVGHSPHAPIRDLAWSSDGRWLAYTLPTGRGTSAIAIADQRTAVSRRVTEPDLADSSPSFDPLGRFLYFIGQRRLTAVRDSLVFGYNFPNASHPYLVTLHAGWPSPFITTGGAPADEPQTVSSAMTEVPDHLDFEGIADRVAAFPVSPGQYQKVLGTEGGVLMLAADGDNAATVTYLDLSSLDAQEYLDGVTGLDISADRRTLLSRHGDRLRAVPSEPVRGLDDGAEPGRGTGWLDLGRVQVPVHPRSEWRQMYRDAWRLQRDHFWDAGMGGVDWQAVYDRYLPLLARVATRAELSDLLWEMQAELGTSHTYEFGGDYPQSGSRRPAFLGVDWAADDRGGARITRLLTGDRTDPLTTVPCRRLGIDIRVGDRVAAVNGRPVGALGPGELLVGRAGHEVELTIERGAEPARRVCVRATEDEAPARYLDWVRANRAFVHESSGGRVGYVHVPDMKAEGYAAFIKGFLAEHDREALVVDVRYNPGGDVSPLILERLARRRRGHESSRWSGDLPYPVEAPRGPVVALVNEHTGSDGDIFAHVFRSMGLGPLVGRRTWGGVIAVHPRHALVDGTVTTQPEYAYAFDDVGRALENRGVEPDIEVDIAPHDYAGGHDPQLLRAVHVALARTGSELSPSGAPS
jgi:tricorn protease